MGKLLAIEHEQRIRAGDIINHPWMVSEARKDSLPSVQDNLKKFKTKLRQIKNAVKAVRLMQALNLNR